MPARQLQLPASLTLPDGTRLMLRLGTPADRAALLAGFERLSPESRVNRFFTAMPKLPERLVDRLTDVDESSHVVIVAFDLDRGGDGGFGVGLARYHRSADDPARAEAAVAVIDEYHNRGIGRLLLEVLAQYAADNGIAAFTASVLTQNRAMLQVFSHLEATTHTVADDASVVEVEVAVPTGGVIDSDLYRLLRHAASPRPGAPGEADPGASA